jgi:hypothetical protein
MADIAELTPKELKEIQDFLKKKQVDIQIRYAPQKIRRIDDGSLIIDAPIFQTSFVKVKPEVESKKNGNDKIETI